MRCKKENFVEGEYFHIYNRTISPFKLFIDRDDYLWFLDKFTKTLKLYPATVFAFCLMPNHFHFLVRQDSDVAIYRNFNDSFSSYVRHYNFKYKRKGSLFEGALQHINIYQDSHFINLCKYIHYNPKKANLVSVLEDWEFSNYLEWIGKRKSMLFEDKILNDLFFCPEDYRDTILEYERFIQVEKFNRLLIDYFES
ncbi:MAG: transposase [Candidatus Cloacimonetes bacterium]|nr:transposase [Candidatus Cloacimonadota bacterium]